MIFLQVLLLMQILMSDQEFLTNEQNVPVEFDMYEPSQGDISFGTGIGSVDHLDESDYATFLDGSFDLGNSNTGNSACLSQNSQLTGKLRARVEQCDNPSASAPDLNIPTLVTEESPVTDKQKPRCDDGEENLCCSSEEISFWNGFRSIVPDCSRSQSCLSSFRFSFKINDIFV